MALSPSVLITGATGTIGQKLLLLLLDSGYRVTAYTRSPQKLPSHPNLSLINGSLENLSPLKPKFDSFDCLIHLAAYMDHYNTPQNHNLINYQKTIKLLKLAQQSRLKKIIYTSTISVFAKTGPTPRSETWPLQKNSSHPYAKSKIKALRWVRRHPQKIITVFPSAVINLSNLMDYPKPLGLIGRIYAGLGQNIPGGLLCRFGSPKRIINIVDVHDIARGLLMVMEKGSPENEYLIVGQNFTVNDFLQKAAACMGLKYNRLHFGSIGWLFLSVLKKFRLLPPSIASIADTTLVDSCFSYDKAKKDLGYQPQNLL